METWMVVIAAVLSLAIGALLHWFYTLQWPTIERALRALTPDQVESALLRAAHLAFDSLQSTETMITPEMVKQLGAELTKSFFALLLTGKSDDPKVYEAAIQGELARRKIVPPVEAMK